MELDFGRRWELMQAIADNKPIAKKFKDWKEAMCFGQFMREKYIHIYDISVNFGDILSVHMLEYHPRQYSSVEELANKMLVEWKDEIVAVTIFI